MAGQQMGICSQIHPKDYIFWFSYDSSVHADKSIVVKEYLEGGRAAAKHLRQIIGDYRSLDEPFSLLEFAAGYGRVTRHLKAALPAARILACDIHEDAVEFLRHMGAESTLSSVDPEGFQTTQKFDVIYALSFFTHMPKATWGRWLSALADGLVPGGHLIFTTHGESALATMGSAGFEPDGFWFVPFSEQKDLSTADYGASATSFEFVYRWVIANNLRLLRYQDAGMGYQDLYVLTKRVDVPSTSADGLLNVEHEQTP